MTVSWVAAILARLCGDSLPQSRHGPLAPGSNSITAVREIALRGTGSAIGNRVNCRLDHPRFEQVPSRRVHEIEAEPCSGAGGAARGAAYGLLTKGARVELLACTPARAESLAGDLRRAVPGGQIAVVGQAPGHADLVVNCTPMGMWPHADESPLPARSGAGSWDGRPRHGLSSAGDAPVAPGARGLGAWAVSGLKMLIYQGAATFEQWTGRPAGWT